MSFLNIALLGALVPLVALPLVIHLLNKKFPKLFPFSHVRNIRNTAAQRSKLLRLRHLILLLLRTLFLALLLLAFLKPMLDQFGSSATASGERYVLLLLDHSLSMEYKGESVTCRQRAVNEAEKVIATLGPGDHLNIMLVGQSPTTCFVDFSRNHAEARRFLHSLRPGLTRADFNQANAAASRLLSKAQRGEIYYLSDFQRKSWANVDFTAIPPGTRLFFTDVSTRKKDNHAILSATIQQAHVLAGDTVAVEVSVGNFSDAPFNDRLTVLVNQRASFERELEIAPWSVAGVTLPMPIGAPGLHLCEVSLPPDGLEADNRFYLTIPVMEKEEILIVSDDSDPDKDAVFYLKSALNPYENLQGSLLPRHIRSETLSAASLAGAQKLFITRANRLSESAARDLAQFLFSGGGAVYFLDGEHDRHNLEQLERVIGPDAIPLRLTTRHLAENVGAGGQQVSKGDFKSPYLKLFRGAIRQDLALLEFYDFYHASATGTGNILLTYADESPAMAAFEHGLGTMLLLNFSVSEFSSNLARQRIFPAWMQELVKAISSDEPPPTSYVAGETIHAEVWRSELRDGHLRSPAGQPVEVKREVLGERYAISFVPDQTGFYTLGGNRLLHAFAANPSPDESDLRAVDKEMLPDHVPGGARAHFVEGHDDYENLILGRPVFHWLIFAALALLLLEAGLQLLFRRLAAPPQPI